MNERLRFGLIALLAFGGALGGAFIGRMWINPPKPVESEIHRLLHDQLDLDAAQKQRIAAIEQGFATRRHALETELRADNARLAAAIQAEHGYGPAVREAVDRSHMAMGELQKATLEHIFAMRAVLRPQQAAQFDASVVKALTAKDQ